MLPGLLNDPQEVSAMLGLAVGAVGGSIQTVLAVHRAELLQTLPNGYGEAF